MIDSRHRAIEKRLASVPVLQRPAGLAEAIRREIPAGLRFPEIQPGPVFGPPRSWRVAAVLFLAIVGGSLGYRLLRDSPPSPGPGRPAVSPRSSTPQPTSASNRLEERVRTVDPTGEVLAGVDARLGRAPRTRDEREKVTTLEQRGGDVAGRPHVTLDPRASYSEQITVSTEAQANTVTLGVGAASTGGSADELGRPSTGGQAEPNDQPFGDVFFRYYGANPFVDSEDDRLSTFGLDVDTGSYRVVARYLRDGHLPPAEAIRVEELVNAFRYGDPPADRSGREVFSLHTEGSPSPFTGGDRYRLLRFHLQARPVDPADRLPATLTFVVDVSGSMGYENRLGLVQRALLLLIDQLRPTDRVGLVVYGSSGRVVLPHTSDRERLRAAVEALVPEGATNAEEGLRLGYDLAAGARRDGGINRVILCSDGVANVGNTGAGSILDRIGEEARRGIELTTVGFGMGNYNDVLMEQLADTGNGRYAYVDDLPAARRIFVEDLTGTLQTVAADAKAQVEFNPRLVERWRLLGYENRDIADERFRDDRVDAGEVGAGQEVTALYEVKLTGGPPRRGVLATLRLRYRPVGEDGPGSVVETAHALRAEDLAPTWEEASRGLRLSAVVAELAELLKGTYWSRGSSLGEVARRAAAAAAEFPGDGRVAELVDLTRRAAEISSRPPAAREDD